MKNTFTHRGHTITWLRNVPGSVNKRYWTITDPTGVVIPVTGTWKYLWKVLIRITNPNSGQAIIRKLAADVPEIKILKEN